MVTPLSRSSVYAIALCAIGLTNAAGCNRDQNTTQGAVVIYASLDRTFSEPILLEFERETGIDVQVVYDTESTKSVGLANRIRAERHRPRCDVFWNNEILNTLLLERSGLLRATHPANAAAYPANVRDADGMWYGFAARARVLIVNTEKLGDRSPPKSMYDLLDKQWRGEVGIAKPVAGTTATHVACLFAVLGPDKAKDYLDGLKSNGVHIEPGNKGCAEAVGTGRLTIAWTDTDDAIIEVDAGKPVTIVYPDSEPGGLGTLFLPNTLVAVRDAPNTDAADKLIDYLLSPDVETRLASGRSAQIPLGRNCSTQPRVRGPGEIESMHVDFDTAVGHWAEAQQYIRSRFLR